MNTKTSRPENASPAKGVRVIDITPVEQDSSSPEDATYHLETLAEQCQAISTADDVQVLVCRCGTPPGVVSKLEDYASHLAMLSDLSIHSTSLIEALAAIPQPVIVAIDGEAMGIELELALAGDIRVCSETSLFGLPQIGQGQIPCFGGTQRLARLVGKGKALEMILTGQPLGAAEAYAMGLVNKTVPAVDLNQTAMQMAATVAAKAPLALQMAKEAVNNGLELPLSKGLRLEADLYFLLHTTRDRTEGVQAFQEKRPPRFEGQ